MIERGYTEIPNQLAEAWARFRIAGEEWQVLWVVVRKTCGWHKRTDTIALSQFAQLTGMRKSHVIRAIKKLEPKRVLVVTEAENGMKTYEVQKDFAIWAALPKKGTVPKKGTIVAKKGNESDPKKGPTKDTTPKNLTKQKYFDSVYLKEEEYQTLLGQHGQETTNALISKLNNHKMSKGTTYKSDYHAILNWVIDAVVGEARTKIRRRTHERETDAPHPVDLVVSN
jgi:phage replication O-like protein O